MKAILATSNGAQVQDIALPQPGPQEILVRVRAASLNRADLSVLASKDGRVMGMEWAGEVAQVGSAVTEWKPGDRVACSGVGAFAEYALADRGRAIRIPDALAFEDASAVMMACLTMHNAIATVGRLQAGEAVLIHGASSGVGLMGLQIAKLLGAGVVIGTSTSASRRDRLHEFGADHAVDPAEPDWVERIVAATSGKGVDLIVDQVTGPAFNQTMRACAVLGRIVNVGRLGGGMGPFDFEWHALRRITYSGVTFRTRSVHEIRDLTAAMERDLSGAIAERRLRLPIDKVFPLQDAASALSRMGSDAHFGKILLTV